MFSFLRRKSVCTYAVGAAMLVGATSHAAPVSVDQTITYLNPPTPILALGNPFLFNFTALPTNALTLVSVRISGVADVDQSSESFEYFLGSTSLGSYSGTNVNDFDFDITFTVSASEVSDGTLDFKILFSDEVNTSILDDFVSVNVQYRADDGGTIPEPGTLALLGLALTGLGASHRRARVKTNE